MKNFSRSASDTYLQLTELSFLSAIISEEIFIERLVFVSQLSDATDIDFVDNLKLKINCFTETWPFQLPHIEFPNETSEPTRNEDDFTHEGLKAEDINPSLHFISNHSGKHGKWKFHKTDNDPFPSIPHGHLMPNKKSKLDAYLGHIYKDEECFDRETRKYIVDLWNDEKFRKFARDSIAYYIKAFPSNPWRVSKPSKLPGKR